MPEHEDIVYAVRAASDKRRLYLPHAVRQMSRPQPMIETDEVRDVVEQGLVIEDYPEDPRGHSCLMLGMGVGARPVHVVCSPNADYLAVITAYLPDEREWERGFRVRRKK